MKILLVAMALAFLATACSDHRNQGHAQNFSLYTPACSGDVCVGGN